MNRSHIIGSTLGLTLMTTAAMVYADGSDVTETLASAPPVVQASVKKAIGNKKLEEFSVDQLGGKTVYEAGFKVSGIDHSYIFNASGELLDEEVDVEIAKIPMAVLDAIKKAHADGKLDEAALAHAGKNQCYAVDVVVGGQTHVIKVNADGSIISDEIEKAQGK